MSRPAPPPDYDDNPEWTDADFARAQPAHELLPPDIVAALMKPAVAVASSVRHGALTVAAHRQGGGAHYLALAA